MNYQLFKESEERMNMDEENSEDDLEQQKRKAKLKNKTPKKEEAYKNVKIAIINFLSTFEI